MSSLSGNAHAGLMLFSSANWVLAAWGRKQQGNPFAVENIKASHHVLLLMAGRRG